MNETRLLRLPAVQARTGFSRSTLYRLEATGAFPQKVKIGAGQSGAVGWLEDEVNDWIDARAAAREPGRNAA